MSASASSASIVSIVAPALPTPAAASSALDNFLGSPRLLTSANVSPVHLQIAIYPNSMAARQWSEVSDFVARCCTLRESENTRPCENCTQNKKVWHESYTSGHCLMAACASGYKASYCFMLQPVAVFAGFNRDWVPLLVKDMGILNIGLHKTVPNLIMCMNESRCLDRQTIFPYHLYSAS